MKPLGEEPHRDRVSSDHFSTFLSALCIDEDKKGFLDSVQFIPLDAHPAPGRPHHIIIAVDALIA